MAEIKEQRWLCGCQIVDGELVRKCTNVKPAGELSAGQVAALPPYSAKCYRLAQQQQVVEASDPSIPVSNDKAVTGEQGGVVASPAQPAPASPDDAPTGAASPVADTPAASD